MNNYQVKKCHMCHEYCRTHLGQRAHNCVQMQSTMMHQQTTPFPLRSTKTSLSVTNLKQSPQYTHTSPLTQLDLDVSGKLPHCSSSSVNLLCDIILMQAFLALLRNLTFSLQCPCPMVSWYKLHIRLTDLFLQLLQFFS